MFHIASVITFGVFLELLWKSNLLVRFRLNRFWPPRMNQFDIRELLSGRYARFIPSDKIVYIYNENLTLGSASMSQLSLTLFPLCNGLLL